MVDEERRRQRVAAGAFAPGGARHLLVGAALVFERRADGRGVECFQQSAAFGFCVGSGLAKLSERFARRVAAAPAPLPIGTDGALGNGDVGVGAATLDHPACFAGLGEFFNPDTLLELGAALVHDPVATLQRCEGCGVGVGPVDLGGRRLRRWIGGGRCGWLFGV